MQEARAGKQQPVAWTEEVAWLEADDLGIVCATNDRFTLEFGWERAALVGQPLDLLVPARLRDAHHLGFSRFVEFGRATVMGQPLRLPMLTAAGETVMTETCLKAEKRDGRWRIGAQLTRALEWQVAR